MSLKNKRRTKATPKVSRKQLRKEKRKEKKIKRNEYYSKRGKHFELSKSDVNSGPQKVVHKLEAAQERNVHNKSRTLDGNKALSMEELHKREKKEQKKIQKGMSKQRKEQLKKANEKEDQTIRKLEKQLKLHKRKSKAIPKSFTEDGLDYLLEVCDPEYMKQAASAEQDLHNADDNFGEDFALITGQFSKGKIASKEKTQVVGNEMESEDNFDTLLNEDYDSETDIISEDEMSEKKLSEDDSEGCYTNEDEDLKTDTENETREDSKIKKKQEVTFKMADAMKAHKKETRKKEVENKQNHISDDTTESQESVDSDQDLGINEKPTKKKVPEKRKLLSTDSGSPVKKKHQQNRLSEDSENEDGGDYYSDEDSISEKEEDNGNDNGVWEDIYGRLRSKDGEVLNNKEGKYIPPAIRAKMEVAGSEDRKRKEKLERLKKQLKGLLNRLAESNMHSIANQIENLYMNNSRHDMNETLNFLVTESLISSVLTPERLMMEHILLITVLHANIGTEVGAHFLQTIIKKFDVLSKTNQEVEDKSLDNVVNILAQLYNFKVFDAKLLYEILQRLANNFEEKNLDCILHILRSVGFGLRKDDPLALKNLILELQKQAASATEGKVSNSRVKFLLDVLLAIKNNNVTKIPNYDTTYSEHLKKIMKGFIRKGNYVSPLNISLEDLLKADERGKWWVVGSAWTGNTENVAKKEQTTNSDAFSQKLLDLARAQRMNTDTRRDIFCIIMSAEDYLDAFEKLLRLGLKNQQQREIIHVLLHCCLQEKTFNPYYAVLAQKFCDYHRKFQMTIKCSVWDKLKTLNSHSGGQLSNLAKLLIHLFIKKGLPISTLKIVEFSELDKITLRLMRQVLLGILLHNDLEAVQEVFGKVAHSDKLKMFRESLRLFIHHFLLRNLKQEALPQEQKQHLEERAKMVEKILTAKDFSISL